MKTIRLTQQYIRNIKRKARDVYVICASPEMSSCIVNAVYTDKRLAEKWAKKENVKLGFKGYWIEQSQLIR